MSEWILFRHFLVYDCLGYHVHWHTCSKPPLFLVLVWCFIRVGVNATSLAFLLLFTFAASDFMSALWVILYLPVILGCVILSCNTAILFLSFFVLAGWEEVLCLFQGLVSEPNQGMVFQYMVWFPCFVL